MSDRRPRCDSCREPISDGAYVCSTCSAALARELRLAGEVARTGEIAITWSRRDVIGTSGIQVDPDPWERASDALYPTPMPVDLEARRRWNAAAGELVTWARHVDESRTLPPRARLSASLAAVRRPVRGSGYACSHVTCEAVRRGRAQGPACPPPPPPVHPVAAVAGWLEPHLGWLRRRPEAGEAWSALTAACRTLVAVVDRPPDRGYVGICGARTMAGTCREPLRPVAGAATVRCVCGAVHDVEVRRRELVEALDDEWLIAEQAAHALTALGVRVTAASIRGYAHRGRLAPHPDSLPGRPRYRVGSIRELVAEQAAAERDRAQRAAKRQARRRDTARDTVTVTSEPA